MGHRRGIRTEVDFGGERGVITFRSRAESDCAIALDTLTPHWGFEETQLRYSTQHTYTPDFTLANGIHLEFKGSFDAADRTKMIAVKHDNPEVDIRFIFMNPDQLLRRGSKITYGGWCDKQGFRYARGACPRSWVEEPGPAGDHTAAHADVV